MPRVSRNPDLYSRSVVTAITVELDDALKHIANVEGRTKSNVMRMALNYYVKHWEETHPEIIRL